MNRQAVQQLLDEVLAFRCLVVNMLRAHRLRSQHDNAWLN